MNSLWLEEKKMESFSELKKDLETEICIIGAGIFGVSTAYYLTKKGYNVILIERETIASKVTGHTTAKITSQHGLIYHYLLKQYGKEFARKYYEANQSSILEIEKIINENQINCDFQKQTSNIYTTNQSEIDKIQEELKSLEILNIEANKIENTPLPFEIITGLEFKEQAKFNPIKYIYGLINKIKNNGCSIYENTTCYDIKKDDYGYICYTKNNKIKAKYVVIATHYPFINFPGIYFAKMYQSSSYVIGVDTNTKLFDGMYINIQSPIYSFRTALDNNKEILLIGGGDHKTGEKIDYKNSYGLLEKKAKEWYPNCNIKYHWSTRDCITLDKIPYIGEFSNTMPNLYVGTGFNKWGMTSSNIGARIIADKIANKDTQYEEIFKATRVNPFINKDEVKNMVSQTVKSLVVERLKKDDNNNKDEENYYENSNEEENKYKNENDIIKNMGKDTGKIIEIDGEKVGIYKDNNGKIYKVKPVCTHLGCILNWNDADKTWDCPCHGSRFDYTGKNIYNPALKGIERI